MNLDKFCIDEQHFRYSLMYERNIEPSLQNYNDTKSIAETYLICPQITYITIYNTYLGSNLLRKR